MTRIRALGLALVAVASSAAGIVGGNWWAMRHTPANHHSIRLLAISSQAPQYPRGYTALFGDSLIEQSYLPTLCGSPTFNVGIGGDSLDGVAQAVQAVLARSNPRAALLEVGVNDAVRGNRVPVEQWRAKLTALLDSLKAAKVDVTVVGIVPARKDGSLAFEFDRLRALDDVLRETAAKRGLRFVDLNRDLSGSDGQMSASNTVDGTHLTQAGYKIWNRSVEENSCRLASAGIKK